MTKKFDDLKSLFAYLEEQISSTLKNEVAKTVVQEMSDTIIEETYRQYIPTEYERRGLNDGLADPSNMEVEVVSDNTISIKNITTGNERYSSTEGWDSGLIDGIIVHGTGYHWSSSRIYKLQPFPRDFYGGTVRRLTNNNKHIEAFKRGMKKRGLTVQ